MIGLLGLTPVERIMKGKHNPPPAKAGGFGLWAESQKTCQLNGRVYGWNPWFSEFILK